MQLSKFKFVTLSLLSSLTLLGISFTATESARADLFDNLQRGIREVTKPIETVKEIHKDVAGGITNVGDLARSLGLAPQPASTDIFDI